MLKTTPTAKTRRYQNSSISLMLKENPTTEVLQNSKSMLKNTLMIKQSPTAEALQKL